MRPCPLYTVESVCRNFNELYHANGLEADKAGESGMQIADNMVACVDIVARLLLLDGLYPDRLVPNENAL